MERISNFFFGFWKKALLLLVIGVLFSVLLQCLYAGGLSMTAVFVTDSLFYIGMSFFVTGLVSLVHNMGAFNGLIYGAKCATAVFRGKQQTSRQMIDGYADFCSGRRKFTDVARLMVCAVAFFAVSVLSGGF